MSTFQSDKYAIAYKKLFCNTQQQSTAKLVTPEEGARILELVKKFGFTDAQKLLNQEAKARIIKNVKPETDSKNSFVSLVDKPTQTAVENNNTSSLSPRTKNKIVDTNEVNRRISLAIKYGSSRVSSMLT